MVKPIFLLLIFSIFKIIRVFLSKDTILYHNVQILLSLNILFASLVHQSLACLLLMYYIVHRLIDGFERISTGEHCSGGYEPYEEDTVALFEQVLPMLWT